jgi:Kef-type K+ transport system membrane component KefB
MDFSGVSSLKESETYLLFESISKISIFIIVVGAGFIIGQLKVVNEIKLIVISLIGISLFPILTGFVLNTINFNANFRSNLTVGIIASASSVPVIYRIFVDHKIINTRFASLVLFVAETQTLLLSLLLSIVLDSNFNRNSDLSQIQRFVIIYFCPILILVIFKSFLNVMNIEDKKVLFLFILIMFMLIYGSFSFLVANNQLFTGMILGWFLSTLQKSSKHASIIDIKYFINILVKIFSPFYFLFIGFKFATINGVNFNLLLVFLIFTSLSKVFSLLLFLFFFKETSISRFNYAFALNVRGGPSIVFADLAFQNSQINSDLFVVFVLTAILTAVMYSNYLNVFRKQFYV